jgi:hypothetical protein
VILNTSSKVAKGARPATSATTLKTETTQNATSDFGRWLEYATIFWIVVLAVSAPHSIAATQIAWLCGMLCWVLRFTVRPRPQLYRTPVDYPLLGFFILTGLTAFLSYAPMVSIGKLRAACLFTIAYLVSQNISSRTIVRFLALALVVSTMVNVGFTISERAIGRGMKVSGLAENSPLFLAGIRDTDTLLEVNGQKLSTPDQLAAALAPLPDGVSPPAQVKLYRYEWIPIFKVPRGKLLPGTTALEQLGIAGWSSGRDWRATGFFGHYTTYAEALQLIASLTLGLFLCLKRKRSLAGILLLIALAGICISLILTVTRGTWLAFLISALLMVLVTARRRMIIMVALCALPLVLGGLFILHQKRNVGFFDQKDDSIRWRQTVQREGLQLLLSKPRHWFVGVGMDSIKTYARRWGLFDKGRLPIGHMHSDYLQLALERGVPALLLWMTLMFIYGRVLWQTWRRQKITESNSAPRGWIDRGIILGSLGGLIGFCTSGVVHYNWGDSEVVMIFYFLMGLSLVVARQTPAANN